MLPLGLFLQGRVDDTARAANTTRATGHGLKVPMLNELVSPHGHLLQGRVGYTARVSAGSCISSLFWLVLPRFNSELRSAFSRVVNLII